MSGDHKITQRQATRRREDASRANDSKVAERRPPTRKFVTRRREIIVEVRLMLVEEGYANLSMRGVAERCGMKLGNLQYYFRTREDLVVCFIQEWIRLEAAERNALAHQSLSPLETILKWIDDVFVYLVATDAGTVMLELWAMTSHDETARRTQANWYAEQRRFYGKLIAVAKPDLSDVEAKQRAMLLMALFEGLVPQVGLDTPLKPARMRALREALGVSARAIALG